MRIKRRRWRVIPQYPHAKDISFEAMLILLEEQLLRCAPERRSEMIALMFTEWERSVGKGEKGSGAELGRILWELVRLMPSG